MEKELKEFRDNVTWDLAKGIAIQVFLWASFFAFAITGIIGAARPDYYLITTNVIVEAQEIYVWEDSDDENVINVLYEFEFEGEKRFTVKQESAVLRTPIETKIHTLYKYTSKDYTTPIIHLCLSVIWLGMSIHSVIYYARSFKKYKLEIKPRTTDV